MSSAAVTFSHLQTSVDKLINRDIGDKRKIITRQALSLPPELPPCNLPPPPELHSKRLAEREQEAAEYVKEKNAGWDSLRGGPTSKDRFFGVVSVVKGFAAHSMKEAQIATSNTMRSSSFSRDLSQFLEEFGDLVRTGTTALITCHEGYVMSEGEPVLVDIFVTTTHLCISGRFLREAIPYREIASVYPSVHLATTELTPFFLHLPDPRVRPTAIQIYTTSMQVYQFLKFAHSARHLAGNSSLIDVDPTTLFYAALDHSWRAGRN